MLVDDDPDDLFILRRLLGKAGIKNKTVAFEDPSAAVAHLEAEIARGDTLYFPCVIFTDLHMPRMNGLEFAAWVRTQPALARSVVMMVTSSERPEDEARAREVGVKHFLIKYPAASVLEKLLAEAGCTA